MLLFRHYSQKEEQQRQKIYIIEIIQDYCERWIADYKVARYSKLAAYLGY